MDEIEITIIEDEELPVRHPSLTKKKSKLWGSLENYEVRVICSQKVIRAVEIYSRENSRKEVGGVLLGEAYLYKGYIYIEITAIIKAPILSAQQNTSGSFNFSPEAWAEMNRVRDKNYEDLKIVGWFHSHPGHGIFLSQGMDTFIQDNYFNRPWQVAMVYDPLRHEGGFFVWEAKQTIEATGFFEKFLPDNSKSIVTWKNFLPRVQKKPIPAPSGLWYVFMTTASVFLVFLLYLSLINYKKIQLQEQELGALQVAGTQVDGTAQALNRTVERTLQAMNSTLQAVIPTNTSTPTPTASLTPSPTETPTITLTPTTSLTPSPTETPTVTLTPTPSLTPSPTKTSMPPTEIESATP